MDGKFIKKNDYITSPFGKLMYVNITGQGKENYDGDDYEYVAAVDIDKDTAKAFTKEIDTFLEDHAEKGKKLRSKPYHTSKDKDGISKGFVRFSFKTKTTFASGDACKVNIFNAANERVSLPDGVKIGNGSIGRISGKIVVYSGKKDYGVSLFLSGVQLKKLEEYVEDSGFDEVDDGEFDNFEDNLKPKSEKKKDKKKKKK